MDPYLEGRWNDVHTRLCSVISANLQPTLPAGLRARAEQEVLLEEPTHFNLPSRFAGDIAAIETSAPQDGATKDASGTAVASVEPIAIRHIPALQRNRWIQIIDTADGNRVITVIAILSPGNKSSGKLNKRYRHKLERYNQAGVNIVEIDLLRSSRNRLLITAADIPLDRRAAYYTCLNRAKEADLWLVYPMPLRTRLPVISIPLRENDSDATVDLQLIMDRIYEEGGHDDINYEQEAPDPPFSAADSEWAAGLIAARGRNTQA